MKHEKSCGCVILDNNKVLLIKDTNQNWGFPKGHVEENETEIETAKRETKEEVNLDVDIYENRRYEISYKSDDETEKTVVYFVARPMEGKTNPQEGEIEDIVWVDFDKALEQITFDDVKELFRKILLDT